MYSLYHSLVVLHVHNMYRTYNAPSIPHCVSQVIEISALTKHWLNECEAKSKFKECPHCREAVLEKQYEGHVTSCRGKMPGGGGHTLCPLCHLRVQDGEEVGCLQMGYIILIIIFKEA